MLNKFTGAKLRYKMTKRLTLQLFFLCMATLCFFLGFWQYTRLKQKQQLMMDVIDQGYKPMLYDVPHERNDHLYRQIEITGDVLGSKAVQVYGRPISQTSGVGARIFVPFVLPNQVVAVLDLGWVSYDIAATMKLKDIKNIKLSGFIMPAPKKPLFAPEAAANLWSWPDIGKMNAMWGGGYSDVYISQSNEIRIENNIFIGQRPNATIRVNHFSYMIVWIMLGTSCVGYVIHVRRKWVHN